MAVVKLSSQHKAATKATKATPTSEDKMGEGKEKREGRGKTKVEEW